MELHLWKSGSQICITIMVPTKKKRKRILGLKTEIFCWQKQIVNVIVIVIRLVGSIMLLAAIIEE